MAERYAAFISYSHQDRAVAAWLQRSLEGYRVPGWIVGRPGAFGAVPARIGAVFRDREDLPASADLAASVRAALDSSDCLIVLCSPAAAASRWVAAEITQFKARAGEDRVLALIVSGEPFASEMPREGVAECMPLPLRRHVGPDGEVSDRVAEPVAADLRHEGDGQRLARLKLIAGLLGIPLDMLIRREHARRQRGWALLAAASMAGTLTMGGLAWEARSARDTARARRADAEQLVDFMLGDLRKRLDAVGRLDVLDSVGAETMRYYARQKPSSLDADELARRARALRLVGEVRAMRGAFGEASAAFDEAARATGELMARDPGNGARVFDHAQSVFWVGSTALKRGELAGASRAMDEYARLADVLTRMQPNNAAWQAEVGYSRWNRGTLLFRRRQISRATTDFEEAANIFASLMRREPRNADWAFQYAGASAWLADARRWAGDPVGAARARDHERAIYTALSARDPNNAGVLLHLAWCDHAASELALDRGDLADALRYAQSARDRIERLMRDDPANVEARENAVRIYNRLALIEASADANRPAQASVERSHGLVAGLQAHDPSLKRWQALGARTDLVQAWLTLRAGDERMGAWLSARANETAAASGVPEAIAPDERAWRAWGRTVHARASPVDARADDLAIVALLEPLRPTLGTDERCFLAAAYRRRSLGDAAATLDTGLARSGYRSPWCSPI